MRKLLVLLLLLCPALGYAQDDSAVQRSLRECQGLSNDVLRLACYDALARQQTAASMPEDSATPAAEPAPPALPAMPVVPTPPRATAETVAAPQPPSEVETFGQQSARVERAADGEDTLVDTVARVRQVEPTKVQVTLASGQVWRQTVGRNYVIREGDTVRISGTNWGKAYRLSVEGRPGFIQVVRQQ